MSADSTTSDAVPCDTNGTPLTSLQPRPSFQVSPHMISFVGGVAITLIVMYFCTQFGSKKRD
jgi:hypothetical protein